MSNFEEIPKDTIIIEISGGVLTAVHNDPNGFILFDWDDDTSTEEEITQKEEALKNYLEQLNQ